ncbi:DMT family transporter [Streptomyces sp. NBC_00557]|uniref:DMT family transporter n=1 Tax=Streptomyces sp. NBC_00557 TaxID=2975776 RepID=UPI002E81C25C|nr:DMT family transporter [Streptomyces sp. NBC_00557]WUC33439.1 DMT family transporter [Streptomyces sp. NBC_00557]
MSALALSVLLSFVSAAAYAAAAIVQEQVAVSSAGSAYVPVRRAGWWGALGLNGLGGVLHVVALAYGPLSLVQPLGALTIVFALPLAALCVGRRAGATAWRGAVMATAGLAGLLALVGSADSTSSLSPAQRVAVALVTGGAVVALMCAGRAAHRNPAVRSVLLATASGVAFGMSSVFTKTVAVDWTHGIETDDVPSLAVIALFSAAGVLLSQASYRGGGLAAPLATLTVVNPVLAAAVGILMFGEAFRYGGTGTALAVSCGVVAAGGLIMLTTERIEHTGAAAAPDTGPEPLLPAEAFPRVPQPRGSAETEAFSGVPERGSAEAGPEGAGPERADPQHAGPAEGDGVRDEPTTLRELLGAGRDGEPAALRDLPAAGLDGEPALRELLGGGGRDGRGGGEPPESGPLPASYLTLSSALGLPLPVPDGHGCTRVRS